MRTRIPAGASRSTKKQPRSIRSEPENAANGNSTTAVGAKYAAATAASSSSSGGDGYEPQLPVHSEGVPDDLRAGHLGTGELNNDDSGDMNRPSGRLHPV